MKPESNRPVALEDLLRLKRAERPPAEFWSEFDRKLREKQLAALVAKRPWWQRLPRLVPTLARYRLVLGSTAVAAIALVAIRDEPAALPLEAAEPAAATETVAVAPAQEPAVGAGVAFAAVDELLPAASSDYEAATAVATVLNPAFELADAEASGVEPVALDNFPHLVALGGGAMALGEKAREDSPSARHIAANLAHLQVQDQGPASRVLVGANGFEARVMPVRTAVDPLQQMTPPGESRRSRLLTAMVATAALETSSRSTERAANRFAEEGVFDQSQRFGARGDRVHVKF